MGLCATLSPSPDVSEELDRPLVPIAAPVGDDECSLLSTDETRRGCARRAGGGCEDAQTGVVHRPCPPASRASECLKCVSARALRLVCVTVPPEDRVLQVSPGRP